MRFFKETNFLFTNFKNGFLKKMFETKEHIDYILGGLRNPFTMRRHALNDISIYNDWVATVIQHLLIGKSVGIFIVNVSNRLITPKIFSISRDQTVKTFKSTAITVSTGLWIAVSKYFQPFNFYINCQIKGAF